MNFTLQVLMVICLCFVEVNCKSIHVHGDFHSEFEVSESKASNHNHDSKNKVSWIKFKPILRREMQHIRHVKGAESTTLSSETTQRSQTNNEENSSTNISSTGNEEIYFKAKTQISNNSIIRTDNVGSNLTLKSGGHGMLGEFAYNTNIETIKVDSPLNKKDFPYNATPDIMNESGDLIVFLALNENENNIENLDSNETYPINEGTTVTLEEISTTGLQLLTDFETRQSLIEVKIPNVQRTLNDENVFKNLRTDFNEVSLKMNHNENSVPIEITNETTILTYNAETSTEQLEVFGTEQIVETSIEDKDDHLQVNFTDFKIKENNSGTNLLSIKSEMRELHENVSNNKSKTSDIGLIKAGVIETHNTKQNLPNSFKNDELTEVSSKRQNVSKCPDPGLCIFWFLALDTCDEDSDCHGSLICCRWGCSKMCIDADTDMI